MIKNTLEELEHLITQAEAMPPDKKQALLTLLATLKAEVQALAATNQEEAASISGFAQVSTHEATRSAPNPQLRNLSSKGCGSRSLASNNPTPNWWKS